MPTFPVNRWWVHSLVGLCCLLFSVETLVAQTDPVSERMLLYQRANGGWPQPGGDPIRYGLELTREQQLDLLNDRKKLDATIDDKSTSREISYLVDSYARTHNAAYLKAAEHGIRYLLEAQQRNGGWGQFYPDTSKYRGQITYNDNAMMDVMNLLQQTVDRKKGFENLSSELLSPARIAIEKGIDCILKTQYKQHGTLTVWGAQYDRYTLLPTNARAFELASLSGSESVGIVKFLMAIENPSPEIKQSIRAAMQWFEQAKLPGISTKIIPDASLPKGRDVVVGSDPSSTLWARFYDLDTNQPIFVGRDGIKRYKLAEIENERRVGYSWYGRWPAALLTEDYPKWIAKWGKN